VEKSRKKRSLEKLKPRKREREMRQQSAWSRNQKVEEEPTFPAPAPPSEPTAAPSTPLTDDRAAEAATERRS
jgi:hypothetical protein